MVDDRDKWKFKYWRAPDLYDLELFIGRHVTVDYPRHMHEEYSIALILGGVDTAVERNGSYSAHPGEISLINAGDVHSSRSDSTDYRIFHINSEQFKSLGAEMYGRKFTMPRFPRAAVRDVPLFRTLLNLHVKMEKMASTLERESMFFAGMRALLQRTAAIDAPILRNGNNPAIRRVRDYLESHYTENVSLAMLASLAGMSTYHLLRVFQLAYQCPPHEYQTQLRVARAKKLLCDGETITGAANLSGFFDQSHLTRNFKRIVGVTPGRYLSESNIVQYA